MQAPLLEQRQQVAGFGQRGGYGIDDDEPGAAQHGLRQFATDQRVRAGGIDVRARFQPVGFEQRLGGGRHGADDGAAAHRFLGTGSGNDSDARRIAHAPAEIGEALAVAGKNLDALERQRGAQGAHVALGLPACTEDAGDPGVRPGQRARRDAARRASAHHAQVVGLDHGAVPSAGRVEQVNVEAVAAAVAGVGLVTEHALRRQRAVQYVQHGLRQAGTGARRVLRLAEGQVAVRRFDGLEGHCRGQHLLDVVFREEEGHAGS